MNKERITWINSTTNDMHDDVASINEELVDDNKRLVKKHIEALITKAKDLKSNLEKDGI